MIPYGMCVPVAVSLQTAIPFFTFTLLYCDKVEPAIHSSANVENERKKKVDWSLASAAANRRQRQERKDND